MTQAALVSEPFLGQVHPDIEPRQAVDRPRPNRPHGAPFLAGPVEEAFSPWYVCLTKPRQEAYAVSKLLEQGYELYLPLLESWARRAGCWTQKQTVMFPRYAFVRPRQLGQSVAAVRSTPGVTSLVRFGPVLAHLSHERLAALQALLASRAAAAPQQPLQPGQQVVFASGPLQGLSGIVSAVAAERVTVLMTLLGQEQRVAGPADNLALAWLPGGSMHRVFAKFSLKTLR